MSACRSTGHDTEQPRQRAIAAWRARERDGEPEEAGPAYRLALQESTQEHAPVRWAETQMNLGGALLALGRRERGVISLGASLTCGNMPSKSAEGDCAPHKEGRTSKMIVFRSADRLPTMQISSCLVEP